MCVQEEEWLLGARVFIEHVLSQPCLGRRWQEDLLQEFPWKTQFVLPRMHLNWSRLHHHMAPRSRIQSKMHLITRASCWTGGFVWSRACVYLAAGKGPGLLTGPAGYLIIPAHHSCSQCSAIHILSLLVRRCLGPSQSKPDILV